MRQQRQSGEGEKMKNQERRKDRGGGIPKNWQQPGGRHVRQQQAALVAGRGESGRDLRKMRRTRS